MSSHTKDFKMVLDTSMPNTHQYKVCIEGKVEQSKERSSALPYTSCYATMCQAGLQGAVRSHQVHRLIRGTDVGCGLPNAI